MGIGKYLEGITPANKEFIRAARRKWDSIAKPLGSLGRFEDMITEVAALKQSIEPRLDRAVLVVFCSDNGVVNEGVSQSGQEVTLSVMKALARDESTVSFMAQALDCTVLPVDIGVNLSAQPENAPDRLGTEQEISELSEVLKPDRTRPASGKYRILNRHLSDGTNNIAEGAAMSRETCEKAVLAGIRLAGELKEAGFDIILTGEMGIGNTTTAAAAAAVLTGEPVEQLAGRGAGLPADKLLKKHSIIKRAIEVNRPDATDPVDVLLKVGGLDMAGLCGIFLGGAFYGIPVVIDGYISSVSALCAKRLCEASVKAMLPSHCTLEAGGRLILESLGKRPVIDAEMFLGEGGGAVMLLPMLRSALNVFNSGHDFYKLGIDPYVRYAEEGESNPSVPEIGGSHA